MKQWGSRVHRSDKQNCFTQQVGKAMKKMHDRKNVGKIILSPMKEPEPEPEPKPKAVSSKTAAAEAEAPKGGVQYIHFYKTAELIYAFWLVKNVRFIVPNLNSHYSLSCIMWSMHGEDKPWALNLKTIFSREKPCKSRSRGKWFTSKCSLDISSGIITFSRVFATVVNRS